MPDNLPPRQEPARIPAAGQNMSRDSAPPIKGRQPLVPRKASPERQTGGEIPAEGVVPDPVAAPAAITTPSPPPLRTATTTGSASKPEPGPVVEKVGRSREPEPDKQGENEPQPAMGLWALRNRFRWALGLLALAVAMFAQKLADDDRIATDGKGVPPMLSWLLFALAAVIFVVAVPSTTAPITKQAGPFIAGVKQLRKRKLFLGLIGAALVCNLLALPLFLALNSVTLDTIEPQGWLVNTGSWLLYILSLFLFGAAWVVWERNTDDVDAAENRRLSTGHTEASLFLRRPALEWLAIGAIFVLALALRLPNLESAPPGIWFDEAQNGIVGRGLLTPNALHPAFIGDFTQMGAFYFYMVGLVGKLFGDTLLWPVRLLPALSGAVIAPMLYLIGSRLYGWRVGLAAGVLVAVSSWNITFSRFGIASLPTVALDAAAYLCVMQALRTGRLGYYAASGVLVGLALQMYYVAQLTPVVLGLVFLYRLISERARFWRSIRAGVGLFVVALLMTFLPVATFAVQHPEVYTQRTGDVSIFSPTGSDGHSDALAISLGKHARMFNYAGDGNGRHNIPGEPMLDWWTGMLFLGGVGVCFLRIRRWHYFYPFIWLLVSLAGGVLTVLFEAPQAHRTLESSVVVSLIAGIFLGELAGVLVTKGRVALGWARRNAFAAGASFALMLPLLGLAGASSIDRYFNRQMNNQSVWNEMLGTDSIIGRYLARYGATDKVYVSAIKADYATSIFLAPTVSAIQWVATLEYPFTEERDTDIILVPSDSTNLALFKQTYPHADVEVTYGPDKGLPTLYAMHIPVADIKAVRGVQQRIYSKDASKPPLEKMLTGLAADTTGAGTDATSVQLSTSLKVERYNSYKFGLVDASNAPATGTITVDGFGIQPSIPVNLTAGLHSVVITATLGNNAAGGVKMVWDDNSGQGMQAINDALLFDPARVQPHGLTALFRNGDGFDVTPTAGRIDPSVSFYFHITPLPRPYTGEWVGKVYAPASGTYSLATEQISNSKLLVDGKEVVVNPSFNNLVSGQVDLQQGLHDIRLLFHDQDGSSHLYLYWTPPGLTDRYVIPAAFLLPVMGQYADPPEYGGWPTINEADDSVWSLSAEGQEGATTAGSGQPVNKPTQPPPAQQQNPPTAPVAVAPTTAPAVDQTEPKAIKPILTLGEQGETLARPKAAALDTAGNIYLYTETDSTIRKFGPDGKLQKKWAIAEADGKPAIEISGLLVKDGKLLALDAATSELISYTLDGDGGERARVCECFFPRGIALSNDGNFWITDTGGARLVKAGADGKTIATIEGHGISLGQFAEPAGVWEAPDGTIYVADVGNSRVQTFSADLKPITAWLMGTSIARDGNRVSGDASGVLVTEYDSRAVVHYDAQGKELDRWVYNSGGENAIPAGITAAGNGKFLVLYPFANKAVLFDTSK